MDGVLTKIMVEHEAPKDENGGKEGGEEYLKDQRMILRTLERLETQVASLSTQITEFRLDTKTEFGVINADVREAKVRSTIFGSIGGVIGGAIVNLFKK